LMGISGSSPYMTATGGTIIAKLAIMRESPLQS